MQEFGSLEVKALNAPLISFFISLMCVFDILNFAF